ncbi:MAG TPA: helix-turn-helix transcriptional regulator [Azospirillaceae bacterium]|nr:helix-turn-helix transcriptional regulator [Azospirillaceae bacterium]
MATPIPSRTPNQGTRTSFGDMLRSWRRIRRSSQLDLALACGVSQRHLSFLESGRARPSRGMVLNLASALDMPLRQQNALLLAAGYAPAFGQRPLDTADMRPVTAAVERMMAQQAPYPALLVDAAYNLLRANAPAVDLLAFLLGRAPAPDGPAPNLVRLLFDPDGLRPHVEDWPVTAAWMVRRLRAELAGGHGAGAGGDLAALLSDPDIVSGFADTGDGAADLPPALVLKLRQGEVRLALLSMIATVGTPLDAVAQDLRLEFFFPADAATDRWFRDRAAASG